MVERPEWRRARERTDVEDAAMAMLSPQQCVNCGHDLSVHQPDRCWRVLDDGDEGAPRTCTCSGPFVEPAAPAVADDRSELERRGWPSGGLGASPKQRAILDRLRQQGASARIGQPANPQVTPTN